MHHDEHFSHYQQFRREHERRLDEDYAAWRQQRFQNEFGSWRGTQQPPAGRHDPGILQSLGRAVSEAITGNGPLALEPQEPASAEAGAPGTPRPTTERFFERS